MASTTRTSLCAASLTLLGGCRGRPHPHASLLEPVLGFASFPASTTRGGSGGAIAACATPSRGRSSRARASRPHGAHAPTGAHPEPHSDGLGSSAAAIRGMTASALTARQAGAASSRRRRFKHRVVLRRRVPSAERASSGRRPSKRSHNAHTKHHIFITLSLRAADARRSPECAFRRETKSKMKFLYPGCIYGEVAGGGGDAPPESQASGAASGWASLGASLRRASRRWRLSRRRRRREVGQLRRGRSGPVCSSGPGCSGRCCMGWSGPRSATP